MEPVSQSEYVPQSAAALNELLLGSAYPRYLSESLFAMPPLLDDDIAPAVWTAQPANNPEIVTAIKAAYTWQPDAYNQLKTVNVNHNFWKGHYAKLLGANAVMDYIDQVTGSSEEKDMVKAQALTLRAFYYFYLVNLYGTPYNENKAALGVPIKTSSALSVDALERNTVEEVYTQILNDLLQAEALYKPVPVSKQWAGDYRTSLPLTQLLLSKVYLYMEDWEKAAVNAEKVINSGFFSLLNLNSIPAPTAAAPYYNFYSYSNPEVIWLYGGIADVNALINMSTGTNANQRYIFNASNELLSSYDATDLRKRKYIVTERYNTSVFKPMAKYLISSTFNPGSDAFARGFRLSEAYLNLAEATAMIYKKNSDGASLNKSLMALNTLRQSRYSSYSTVNITDATALVNFTRNERRRELCLEGQRWFDLRRYGMPEIKHQWVDSQTSTSTYTLTAKDPAYTLPIPTEAIELNSKLIQNPLPPVRTN